MWRHLAAGIGAGAFGAFIRSNNQRTECYFWNKKKTDKKEDDEAVVAPSFDETFGEENINPTPSAVTTSLEVAFSEDPLSDDDVGSGSSNTDSYNKGKEGPSSGSRPYRPPVFSARFKPYTLGEVIPLTHDVALFRFLLDDPEDEFNLKPCSTLQVMYKYGVQAADQCQRFYTPVTANGTKGYFDLIVKRKTGGSMTNHLFGMHIGDRLLIRSIGLKVQYRPNRWDHVGLIAGGTGFTPMLQVIRHALDGISVGDQKGKEEEQDRTRLGFLFCNRTEKHVLLKGLFDDYARRFPDRFKVRYAIDRAVDKAAWKGYIGYVTPEMIKETMPSPSEKNYVVLLCGPDQLLNHVAGVPMGAMTPMSSGLKIQPIAADANNLVELGGVLGAMGYDNGKVYRF